MKVIIDIPDNAYELLKNKQVLDNIAESIIANGTPYAERPQGDLISRTWLKEHKFTTQVCNGLEIEDVDVVGVATIDNAPTIEDLSEYSDKLWQKAYERGKAERPTEVNCSHCDYFKFSQSFIENIVKFMTDYNIESVEDLMRELNHINELLGGRE